MRKRILMIGTGGTIASKKTENGLKPGLSSEDILSYIPQVEQVCEVRTMQVCNIDSTNVTPEHWTILSKTIEDCAEVTEEILRQEFGERITELVLHESEDKTKSWKERKSATIERLKTASLEVQYIGLADKLSNIRDIDRDYPLYKEELWNRFRMKDKQVIGWYYKEIKKSLRSLQGLPAYEEYCRLVERNFG